MRTTTKGENVFELVDNFFKENSLQWSKIIGLTTDGAPAVLGRKSGFQARVKISVSICHFRSLLHTLIRSRC